MRLALHYHLIGKILLFPLALHTSFFDRTIGAIGLCSTSFVLCISFKTHSWGPKLKADPTKMSSSENYSAFFKEWDPSTRYGLKSRLVIELKHRNGCALFYQGSWLLNRKPVILQDTAKISLQHSLFFWQDNSSLNFRI